jgi:uncharacterized membrane protein YfcA
MIEPGIIEPGIIELGITILCGIGVGLSLGLTGGGGSNFAVPLLIFVIGLTPSQAIPVSLAAVAIIAAAGAIHAVKKQMVFWQPTILFASGGMLGAPLGFKLAYGIDAHILITGFALLALVVGASMAWRSFRHPLESAVVRALTDSVIDDSGPVCRLAKDGRLRLSAPCSIALAVAGLVAGLLAGFFGVGGGFIIVPALMFITRMGIHSAVATSMVVIAVTGLTGASYAASQGSIQWPVLLPFISGGLLGMLLGRVLASRIAGPRLQQYFAASVIIMASAMLIDITFF